MDRITFEPDETFLTREQVRAIAQAKLDEINAEAAS